MERVVTIPLSEADMDKLHGRARPLVIAAPSKGDGRVTEQLRILEAAAHGLGERYMPVLTDFGGVDGFELRLIGKDGTVKRRFETPVDAETLFEIVDAMPMRKDEMERDGDPG